MMATRKPPADPRKPPASVPDPDAMPSARLRYDRKGAARQLSIDESTQDTLTANKELATVNYPGLKAGVSRAKRDETREEDHVLVCGVAPIFQKGPPGSYPG
jgi:hypothetical protein